MTDLHTTVTHRLAELRAVAQAATPGPWTRPHADCGDVLASAGPVEVAVVDSTADGDHIATWNPAHSLRWIEWAEDLADRHKPTLGNDLLIWCWACSRSPDFCPELAGLANALDIEVSG